MLPIRPVEPVPPYEPGPMPPRTPVQALLGFGAVALGVGLLQVFPLLLLSKYVALGALALSRIARFPKRYEGRPMALAAVILGLLEALAYGVFAAAQAAGLIG